ncbi:HalOD1 output domain-containing protein [Natrinema sp. J7-1]|uniref:HalOD1 output domain-containing protein n=1 Tax=Natrinema sp. J7-1 TaxID=1172566 RepID=UPI00067803D1|nr:HalOD1 output domain-containing protein [Natrinema sp. J7-1]
MNSLEPTADVDTADEQLSMAGVDLVARTSDTDPVELEPLYDAIDPDLLDSLPAEAGFTSLEFAYHGYIVTVTATGESVEVTLEDGGGSADESTDTRIDSSP